MKALLGGVTAPEVLETSSPRKRVLATRGPISAGTASGQWWRVNAARYAACRKTDRSAFG